jgi:hypothetical protein
MNETNHLVWLRWRERLPQEVLDWHRQVQQDLIAALNEAPDEWFSGKEHGEPWPFDVDGHSAYHRLRDLEAAVRTGPAGAALSGDPKDRAS